MFTGHHGIIVDDLQEIQPLLKGPKNVLMVGAKVSRDSYVAYIPVKHDFKAGFNCCCRPVDKPDYSVVSTSRVHCKKVRGFRNEYSVHSYVLPGLLPYRLGRILSLAGGAWPGDRSGMNPAVLSHFEGPMQLLHS